MMSGPPRATVAGVLPHRLRFRDPRSFFSVDPRANWVIIGCLRAPWCCR